MASDPSANLFGDEWGLERDRPGWQWKRLNVGDRLAPGQKTFAPTLPLSGSATGIRFA